MAIPLTSNRIVSELNLSRSTFYYLVKNGLINVPTTSTGRYIWDEQTISKMREALTAKTEKPAEETPKFKTTNINNRRYLGNKYKLLTFILALQLT